MGRLVYTVIGSLDGYMADATGNFDWAMPDDDVMDFLNEQGREITTYLYGRRIYELMTVWETDPAAVVQSDAEAGFADMWQAARKLVYSTTLEAVTTERTELRRHFDVDEVRALKADTDLEVSGPTLARHAFRAGLVDEFQVIVVPVLVGGGLSYYPDVRAPLTLRDTRRFGNGFVGLSYDVGAIVP